MYNILLNLKEKLIEFEKSNENFENLYISQDQLDYLLDNIGNIDSDIRDDLIYNLLFLLLNNGVFTEYQFNYIVKYIIKNNFLITDDFSMNINSVIKRSFSYLAVSLLLSFDNYRYSKYYSKIEDKDLNYFIKMGISCLNCEISNIGYVEKYGWIHSISHLSEFILSIIKHFKFDDMYITDIIEGIFCCLTKQKEVFKDEDEKRIALIILYLLDNNKFSFENFKNFINNFNNFYKEKSLDKNYINYIRSKENVKNMLNFISLFYKNNPNFYVVYDEILKINDVDYYRNYISQY